MPINRVNNDINRYNYTKIKFSNPISSRNRNFVSFTSGIQKDEFNKQDGLSDNMDSELESIVTLKNALKKQNEELKKEIEDIRIKNDEEIAKRNKKIAANNEIISRLELEIENHISASPKEKTYEYDKREKKLSPAEEIEETRRQNEMLEQLTAKNRAKNLSAVKENEDTIARSAGKNTESRKSEDKSPFAFLFNKTAKTPALELQPHSWEQLRTDAKTTDEYFKQDFIQKFVEPIKKGETPKNGFLVEGPDSEGKKEFFDWGIEQLRKAGVEIIDSTDETLGHSTEDSLGKLVDILQPAQQGEFKNTNKYKLFVLRGMEKISPKNNHLNISATLRGRTAKSAENYGVMLAYDCVDSKNFMDAVTRMERIDEHYIPKPKADESMDIWRAYLQTVQDKSKPIFASKTIQESKELLKSKKGQKAVDELGRLLEYNPPYVIPKSTEKMKVWEEYFNASKEKLTDRQLLNEYTKVITGITNEKLYGSISEEKYNKLLNMARGTISKSYKDRLETVIDNSLHQRM